MMEVSNIDKDFYKLIRKNVTSLIKEASINHDSDNLLVLDIAPEIHKGASEHFKKAIVKTLDINPKSGAHFIADLCKDNSDIIPSNTFDVIICTEVLEHTENPFNAASELLRILKTSGTLYVSTPFNFRIHGPLPDNWRFTIHGLKQLFKEASVVNIRQLEDPDRNLMPIQYTSIIKK